MTLSLPIFFVSERIGAKSWFSGESFMKFPNPDYCDPFLLKFSNPVCIFIAFQCV